MSPTPTTAANVSGPGASAIVAWTPTAPLQMPRSGRRAHWPYDRVDKGLTKTAGQCPERWEDLVEAESEPGAPSRAMLLALDPVRGVTVHGTGRPFLRPGRQLPAGLMQTRIPQPPAGEHCAAGARGGYPQ